MPDQVARAKRDQKQATREKKQDNPGVNSKLESGDEESQLDKALMDSFPSSDPPSQSQPTKSGPAGDPNTKP
jgi:hypothetical protein